MASSPLLAKLVLVAPLSIVQFESAALLLQVPPPLLITPLLWPGESRSHVLVADQTGALVAATAAAASAGAVKRIWRRAAPRLVIGIMTPTLSTLRIRGPTAAGVGGAVDWTR